MTGGNALARLGPARREVVALVMPTVERYAHLLTRYEGQPATPGRLVRRSDLAAVIGELEGALMPASGELVQFEVTKLLGGFAPTLRNIPEGDQRILAVSLAEDLGAYPDDVIRKTVRHARRTLRFFSIAEVVAIADELVAERRGQLGLARRMVSEYERRDRDAARTSAEREASEAAGRASSERIAAEIEAAAAAPEPFDRRASLWVHAAQELALRGAAEAEIAAIAEGLVDQARRRQLEDLATARRAREQARQRLERDESLRQSQRELEIARGLDPERMEAVRATIREATEGLAENFRTALFLELAACGRAGEPALVMERAEALAADLKTAMAVGGRDGIKARAARAWSAQTEGRAV